MCLFLRKYLKCVKIKNSNIILFDLQYIIRIVNKIYFLTNFLFILVASEPVLFSDTHGSNFIYEHKKQSCSSYLIGTIINITNN